MTMHYNDLVAYRDKLLTFREHTPNIAAELIIGEGVYAVGQAKKIAKNDNPDIVNTGAYRNNFHAGNKALSHSNNKDHDGSKPQRSGKTYRIDVYNNIDYAKHIEHGFRSHWVPGRWEGHTFVYIKGYKPTEPDDPGGMYVGPKDGYVKGRYVLARAIKRTKTTQKARLSRKFNQRLREYLEV